MRLGLSWAQLPAEVVAWPVGIAMLHQMPPSDCVFAALLKYWRGQRGMSQFELGLVANVSARHISFLETGRSRPSIEMVLLLAEALDVPLRNRNEMLRAAGFDARYPEPGVNEAIAGRLGMAIDAMLEHHEPLPMIVFDRFYTLMRANDAGTHLLGMLWPDRTEHNLLRLIFGNQTRSVIENWEELASSSLRRLQRELLYNANDHELRQLLEDLLQEPGVPQDWRQPKLSSLSEPFLAIVLRVAERRLSFLMSITAFDAPQNITLNELRIESWFPLDPDTESFCEEALARR